MPALVGISLSLPAGLLKELVPAAYKSKEINAEAEVDA